ncbi:MAG: dihydroorotate dehydrogenase [Actinomycetota bacterium]
MTSPNAVETQVRIGSVTLDAPVMTASGTAGYGSEIAPYFGLAELGAVVTKSLSAMPWPGNPAPRLAPAGQGMLNSVGLQGPGVEAWCRDHLPQLAQSGAAIVASIWGRSVDEFAAAADALAPAADHLTAVEVNLSCPNLEARGEIFAHDADLSGAVVEATAGCGRPRWAKLSANTDRIVDVAASVAAAGAEAVTCVNTLLGMSFSPASLAPTLGAGVGGFSGAPMHPVAVRAVHDVHAELPELPIVAVGGVTDGWSAVEMVLAGASAVQVGTATFADPRAPLRVQQELVEWCRSRGVDRVADIGALA